MKYAVTILAVMVAVLGIMVVQQPPDPATSYGYYSTQGMYDELLTVARECNDYKREVADLQDRFDRLLKKEQQYNTVIQEYRALKQFQSATVAAITELENVSTAQHESTNFDLTPVPQRSVSFRKHDASSDDIQLSALLRAASLRTAAYNLQTEAAVARAQRLLQEIQEPGSTLNLPALPDPY